MDPVSFAGAQPTHFLPQYYSHRCSFESFGCSSCYFLSLDGDDDEREVCAAREFLVRRNAVASPPSFFRSMPAFCHCDNLNPAFDIFAHFLTFWMSQWSLFDSHQSHHLVAFVATAYSAAAALALCLISNCDSLLVTKEKAKEKMGRNDARPEEATSLPHFSFPARSSRLRDQDATRSEHAVEEEDDAVGSDDEEELMTVIVKMVGNTEDTELFVSQDASVLDLKTSIHEELALPAERQRLIFSGRMLSNDDDFLVDDVKMLVDAPNYIHLAPIPERAAGEPNITRRTQNENDNLLSDEDDYDEMEERGLPPFFGLFGRAPHRHQGSREARRIQASPYGSIATHLENLAPYRGQPRQSPLQDNIPPLHAHLLSGTSIHQPAVPVAVPATLGLPSIMPCQGPSLFASFGPPPMGLAGAAAIALRSSMEPPHVPLFASAHPFPFPSDLNHYAQASGVSRDLDSVRMAREMIHVCRDEVPQQLIHLLTSTPGSNASPLQELDYQAQLETCAFLMEELSQRSLLLADTLHLIRQRRHEHQTSTSQPPSSIGAVVPSPNSYLNDLQRLHEDPRSLYY